MTFIIMLKTDQFLHIWHFLFLKIRCLRSNKAYCSSNKDLTKCEQPKRDARQVFKNLVTFQLILKVLQLNFSELVLLIHIYWHKNWKINKTSIFLTLFCKNGFWKLLEGSIIDCFYTKTHFNLESKNRGLTPGVDLAWVPVPQDAVWFQVSNFAGLFGLFGLVQYFLAKTSLCW